MMKLIEGDRGKLFLQIEHEERAPFYLFMAAAWMVSTKDGLTDRLDREFPWARVRMQRLLDELKRKMT